MAGPSVLLGLALTGALVVLGTNSVVGFGRPEPIGWILGTLAAWGLLGLWCFAILAWSFVVDPRQATCPLTARLRSAALLLAACPARCVALGLVEAGILAISALLTVALLTVGLSFMALVACRFAYEAVDRRAESSGAAT